MDDAERFANNQRQLEIIHWQTRYLVPKPVKLNKDNRYCMLYGVAKAGWYVLIPDDTDSIIWVEYFEIHMS